MFRNKPSHLQSNDYPQEPQDNSKGKEESFQQMALKKVAIHVQNNFKTTISLSHTIHKS